MLITNQASLHVENITKTFGFVICYPWKVSWISYVEFHGVKELHNKIIGCHVLISNVWKDLSIRSSTIIHNDQFLCIDFKRVHTYTKMVQSMV